MIAPKNGPPIGGGGGDFYKRAKNPPSRQFHNGKNMNGKEGVCELAISMSKKLEPPPEGQFRWSCRSNEKTRKFRHVRTLPRQKNRPGNNKKYVQNPQGSQRRLFEAQKENTPGM